MDSTATSQLIAQAHSIAQGAALAQMIYYTIGIIILLIGFIFTFYTWINKTLTKHNANIEKEINEIKEWSKEHNDKVIAIQTNINELAVIRNEHKEGMAKMHLIDIQNEKNTENIHFIREDVLSIITKVENLQISNAVLMKMGETMEKISDSQDSMVLAISKLDDKITNHIERKN